jgi:hypothetical protein
MDGSSLLEAGTQIQSENAIGQRWRFLSFECLEGCDTLSATTKHPSSQGRTMTTLTFAVELE